MVSPIKFPNRNPLAGAIQSAGSGIASGLDTIIGQKVDRYKRQPIIQELTQLGIDPQSAQWISRLAPKDQLEALQNYGTGHEQSMQMGGQMGIQQPYGQQMVNAQQRQQQSPMMGGTQAQEAYRSPLLGGGGSKQLLARQKAINSQNAPFNKGFSKARENAESATDILQQMKGLLDTGKVYSGLKGTLSPALLQNDETQIFDKLSNQLAQMLAGQTGVPTGFKIKFAQLQKPNINQNPGTQRKLIESMLEEAGKVLTKAEIHDQLIAMNGGEQPSNLETLINQQYKFMKKNGLSLPSQEEEVPEQQMQQLQGGQEQAQYNDQDESLLGQGVRGLVRGASRVGEAIAGAPGDLAAAGLGVGNWATGGAIPSYGEVQEKLPVSFPTSEQLKEATGRATKGYTNPQGSGEEFVDDFVSTIGSLAIPTKIKIPFIKNLEKVFQPATAKRVGNVLMPFSGVPYKKALGIGTAGKAAEGTAALLGGGPLAQGAAKFTGMVLAGTKGGREALTQQMKNSYADARKEAAGTLTAKNTVPAQGVLRKIDAWKSKMSKLAVPEQQKLMEIGNQVEQGLLEAEKGSGRLVTPEAFKNRIPVQDVLDQKTALNDWYHLTTEQRIPGEKFLSVDARKHLGELNGILKDELKDYAKINPKFGEPLAIADDIFKGLNQYGAMSEFFKMGPSFSSTPMAMIKKMFVKGAATLGIDKISEVYTLFNESPVANKYYKEMVRAAAENNIGAFNRAAAKLDHEAMRWEKKQK